MGVVVYGLSIAIVGHAYSKSVAIVMALPAVVLIFIWIRKLPAEQSRAIEQSIKKQEESAFGRSMKVVKYVLVAALLWGIGSWLFGNFWK